jgi:hypothetical protein
VSSPNSIVSSYLTAFVSVPKTNIEDDMENDIPWDAWVHLPDDPINISDQAFEEVVMGMGHSPDFNDTLVITSEPHQANTSTIQLSALNSVEQQAVVWNFDDSAQTVMQISSELAANNSPLDAMGMLSHAGISDSYNRLAIPPLRRTSPCSTAAQSSVEFLPNPDIESPSLRSYRPLLPKHMSSEVQLEPMITGPQVISSAAPIMSGSRSNFNLTVPSQNLHKSNEDGNAKDRVVYGPERPKKGKNSPGIPYGYSEFSVSLPGQPTQQEKIPRTKKACLWCKINKKKVPPVLVPFVFISNLMAY